MHPGHSFFPGQENDLHPLEDLRRSFPMTETASYTCAQSSLLWKVKLLRKEPKAARTSQTWDEDTSVTVTVTVKTSCRPDLILGPKVKSYHSSVKSVSTGRLSGLVGLILAIFLVGSWESSAVKVDHSEFGWSLETFQYWGWLHIFLWFFIFQSKERE